VLELAGVQPDDPLIDGWRARVDRARLRLGWAVSSSLADSTDVRPSVQEVVARYHATGVALALAAPCDQLFTATEVNEWALCAALLERDPLHWASLEGALVEAAHAIPDNPGAAVPPVLAEVAAMARFERLADLEARPELRALIDAADARGLAHLVDESILTLGTGAGGRSFPLAELPFVNDVPWLELRDVPTALVTGSNGKTTTVRFVAACARAHGWRPGFNCTDGVFVDGNTVDTGDYSGPLGARLVLRDPRAEAAAIETARGGILRRGIAVNRVRAAIVTNVSSDHFGEYGIHDLGGLADAKLSVAGAVEPGGTLVLNADDPLLRSRAMGLVQRYGRAPRIAWFALDAGSDALAAERAAGGVTCGVHDGHLVLHAGGVDHDLGTVDSMPLTVEGSATYNVANLAGGALVAWALGVPPGTVASVAARFGARAADNAGRMMRYEVRGVRVLVDYAHNPEGIRGLLQVARHLQREGGRLGMILGHAGNRQDADIRALASVAAGFRPDLVVVKEDESYLRGRAPGEIPRLIREELLGHGMPESALPLRSSELEGVRAALDWSRPGDVLALPVHSAAARAATLALLESMQG
jgi:UDP-N-acetylmuramyl tripeptide synthase